MGFRIKSGQFTIEADTRQEFLALLNDLGIFPGKKEQDEEWQENEEDEEDDAEDVPPHPSPQADTRGQDTEEKEESDSLNRKELVFRYQLRQFMGLIRGNRQETLVRLLLQPFPKGYKDSYIRRIMHLSSNRELGPILTAITKNATKCNLEPIITKRVINDGQDKYAYFLAAKVAEVLKQEQEQKQKEEQEDEQEEEEEKDEQEEEEKEEKEE